jgi:hypothetical protein
MRKAIKPAKTPVLIKRRVGYNSEDEEVSETRKKMAGIELSDLNLD